MGQATRSIVLIGKERFRSNLRQYLQIIGALLMTSFCISLAWQLFRVLEKPFDTTFEHLKASHLLLLFEDENEIGTEIIQWFKAQDEVVHVGSQQPYHVLSNSVLVDGRELDMDIQLTERIVMDTVYDRLKIIKGKKDSYPNIGEIWLPYHFETIHGVHIGDTLKIPSQGKFYELEVSAFVVDPHYLSNLFNPTRAWMAPGSLSFFLPAKDLKNRSLGIRLSDGRSLDAVWKRFEKTFDYNGIDLRYTLFKSAYSGFFKILSIALLIFGIILLLISLIVIRASVSGSVLSDYKQIGVLKSIGYTEKNIIGSYTLQSLFWVLAGVPIGLFLSRLAIKAFLAPSLQNIGISELSVNQGYPMLMTGLLIMGSVLLICFLTAQKAGNTNPIEALRDLKSKGKRHFQRYRLPLSKNMPLVPWFAMRFIKDSIPNSISMILSFVGTLLMLLLTITMYSSFDSLGQNKTAWGFDKSDLILTRQSSIVLPLNHNELMEILHNQEPQFIEQIIPFSNVTANIINEDLEKQQVFGRVYSDTLSAAGLLNLYGKHPTRENEVALCTGTAQFHHKTVGDSIRMEIDGVEKMYNVMGIYQDIGAFGQGIRLHEQAMLAINPIYEPSSYGLVLPNKYNSNTIKEKLLGELGETVTIERSIESRKSIIGLLENMKLGLLSIAILFSFILLIIIGNDITLQIKQHDLIYAQLKSIGFFTYQLRSIILVRIILLFVVALILSIPLGLLLADSVSEVLASGLGMQEFPFVVSPFNIAMANLILLLFVLTICWISSTLIKKINPRKLVEI